MEHPASIRPHPSHRFIGTVAPLLLGILVWIGGSLWGESSAASILWHDAVVARVNEKPVLQSDLELQSHLQGDGIPFARQSADQQNRLIDRLIAQHLLLVEARRFGVAPPSPDAIGAAIQRLRAERPAMPRWIDSDTLFAAMRDRLWADALVDARIRAFVMVRDAQVALYLAQQGGPRPEESNAQARSRIRAALTEREADSRLTTYLERLRSRAQIKRYTSAVRPQSPSDVP